MQGISRAASGQAKKPGTMLAAHRRGRAMADRTAEPAATDLGCGPAVEAATPGGVPFEACWDDQRLSNLVTTIEREIIPRLVLAHRPGTTVAPLAEALGRVPSAQDVDDLTQLV